MVHTGGTVTLHITLSNMAGTMQSWSIKTWSFIIKGENFFSSKRRKQRMAQSTDKPLNTRPV